MVLDKYRKQEIVRLKIKQMGSGGKHKENALKAAVQTRGRVSWEAMQSQTPRHKP